MLRNDKSTFAVALRRWLAAPWDAAALRRLAAFVPGHRLYEVGCGEGGFLRRARRDGWPAAGCEVDAARAQRCRDAGLEAHAGDFLAAPAPPASRDAVVFRYSLEHFADPAAALRRAHAMLAPGGSVMITTPNATGWQARWFGANWFQRRIPDHATLFTAESLAGLAQLGGFEVAESRTVFAPMSLAGFAASLAPSLDPEALCIRKQPGRALLLGALAAVGLAPNLVAALLDHGDALRLIARKAPA